MVVTAFWPDLGADPEPPTTPRRLGARLGREEMTKKLLRVGVLVGKGEGTPGAVPQ